ncbi:threonine aldolase family protein [Kribbella sp. NPDC058245]|uniref:threonine aldolase family protein n=1 Tax=Kribbella sp. NPDC058245 TaxID=3346399 RepID=UPI0036EDFC2F
MDLLPPEHSFVSDNAAGAHPAVLDALVRANVGDATPYGGDRWTAAAVARIRDLLGAPGAEVLFTYGGTGANVAALQAAVDPFEAVITASTGHVHTDECGAFERFTGSKILDVPTADGKLTPELIAPLLNPLNGEHNVQPAVIAISQATELGTVYSLEEIKALADLAHAYGMLLFLDGARIANAAAALDCSLQDLAGHVDILTLGGTKNGMLYGEAMVVLRPELIRRARFARKQFGQLASKMRFIAAQFDALLSDNLWLHNAQHANRMAARLADGIRDLPGVELMQAPQTNSVFARLPAEAVAPLQQWSPFLKWGAGVRWMTSFATTEQDVDRFLAGVAQTVQCADFATAGVL